MGPKILSIMARCSLLSWVWETKNRAWHWEPAAEGQLPDSGVEGADKTRSETTGGLQKVPSTHLEQCEANVVLEDDAAYAPHVTRLRPAQLWVGT